MKIYLLPVLGLASVILLTAAPDPASAARASRLALAQKAVQSNPTSPQAHIELAAALCRQAYYSQSTPDYEQASAALDLAAALAPLSFDGQKLRVVILLGRHNFPEALRQASALNHKVPDDVAVWAQLVDANLALGNYPEAEKAAQWILDLRRGSTIGFIKAAAFREATGDPDGATEFYQSALLRTAPSDAEERAWLLAQDGRIQLASNNLKRASALFDQALALDAASFDAVAGIAALKSAQGDYPGAVDTYRQLAAKHPAPSNLYHVALALEKSHQTAEAETAFREFEVSAKQQTGQTLNANRELVFYYADHVHSAAQALAIAVREAQTRHDAATLDAYAWALFRAGKMTEAKTQIELALAPGAHDASYLCHEKEIAAAIRHGKEIATAIQNPEASKDSVVCSCQ